MFMGAPALPAYEVGTACGELAFAQATTFRVATIPCGTFPSYAIEVVGTVANASLQVAGMCARCSSTIASSPSAILHS